MCAIKDIYGEIRAANPARLSFVVDHMLVVICPADKTVKTNTSNGLHTWSIRVGYKKISATGNINLRAESREHTNGDILTIR